MNERIENGVRLVALDCDGQCYGCYYDYSTDCPKPTMCDSRNGRTDGRSIIWAKAETVCSHNNDLRLTKEEIYSIAHNAQMFFARNFGGCPSDWSHERVRMSPEFQAAVTEIVRATESAIAAKLGVLFIEKEA